MRIIYIRQRDYSSADEVHARLARSLAFPSHYGANLDALNDCLSELEEPTLIIIQRASYLSASANQNHAPSTTNRQTDYERWFERFERVLLRAAREIEMLAVSVRPAEPMDMCTDLGIDSQTADSCTDSQADGYASAD